jgi:hypothetical protein
VFLVDVVAKCRLLALRSKRRIGGKSDQKKMETNEAINESRQQVTISMGTFRRMRI